MAPKGPSFGPGGSRAIRKRQFGRNAKTADKIGSSPVRLLKCHVRPEKGPLCYRSGGLCQPMWLIFCRPNGPDLVREGGGGVVVVAQPYSIAFPPIIRVI